MVSSFSSSFGERDVFGDWKKMGTKMEFPGSKRNVDSRGIFLIFDTTRVFNMFGYLNSK